VLGFAVDGCVGALEPLVLCVFEDAAVCDLPELADVAGCGVVVDAPVWFWLPGVDAPALPLPVVPPEEESFCARELRPDHGEPAVGVDACGGGLACMPVSGCEAASSKAENGSDAVFCWLAAAAAARCEDWRNDDVELTSDARLGTALDP
jgi:hypothetical protein